MADTPTGKAVDTDGGKQPKSVRVVLLALMIAMMLAMLDNMIIGTAMPTIVGELGGLEHLSWVVTAYTLATAASTPLWGKIGDMYGRKGSFMSSIVIF
ncbi:MFS transporter, partial [Streptomyces sp. SID5910]|uniref:MFS transporter n=1 Tax=Streptomyces sp. SID5910 TaxID=2690312 RepID=UPI00136B0401